MNKYSDKNKLTYFFTTKKQRTQRERSQEGAQLKTRLLSLRPQIGYFIRRGLHQNFIVETDIAYTLKKANRRTYLTPSIGLGYIVSFENIAGSVNLGSGEVTQEKETVHFFLPTFNLEIGKVPKKYLGYFFKLSLGQKISSRQPNATYLGAEIGLKFFLKRL